MFDDSSKLNMISADDLGLIGDDRERGGDAGWPIEDGTPLTFQNDEGTHLPVMNNFTCDSDLWVRQCPFQAHIRKTNLRGSGAVPASRGTNAYI